MRKLLGAARQRLSPSIVIASAIGFAALAAAVLIATQIAVEHWFYLYLVWFAPLVWVALLTPSAESARSSPPAAAPTPVPAPR